MLGETVLNILYYESVLVLQGDTIQQEVIVSPEPLRARDGDTGRNSPLRYSLVESPTADYFTVDPDTGRLYVTKHLDRENLTDDVLTLHVRAVQVSRYRGTERAVDSS